MEKLDRWSLRVRKELDKLNHGKTNCKIGLWIALKGYSITKKLVYREL